jgi:adenosine deaminase
VFLAGMPKGGDLHNHLGGSTYAEDWLGWSAARGFCADADFTRPVPPPCPADRALSHLAEADPIAWNRLVDSLSTRGVMAGRTAAGVNGHDQFFGSFARFGPGSPEQSVHELAATMRQAAWDRLGYLELMYNPAPLSAHIRAAAEAGLTEAGLPAALANETPALADVIARSIAEIDRVEAGVRAELGCGTPAAEPACALTVRYLAYGRRDAPPGQVFRSLLSAFALADRDPRVLGIDIVEPEDWPVALRDYGLHMAMIRYLGARYPHVHRSLHAGELAFGLVAPGELRDHIARALDAGAQRIGHGTDMAYEADARATMARMARARVAVEINLTSNAVILGVSGRDHPVRLYRDAGVPVVLCTDDQGVLRTDMTAEWVRAVREQGFTYADLKRSARTSIEASFLPGASLWANGTPGRRAPACAASLTAGPCAALIATSDKARAEATLETRLAAFEAKVARDGGAPQT